MRTGIFLLINSEYQAPTLFPKLGSHFAMWLLDLSTASRIVISGQASTGIVLFLPYFEITL